MWWVVGRYHCTSDCPYWRALQERNLQPRGLSLLRSMHFRTAARGLGSSVLRCTSHFLGEELLQAIASPAACCDFQAASRCRSRRSWEWAGPRCTVPRHRLECYLVLYLCVQCLVDANNLNPRRISSTILLWFLDVSIQFEPWFPLNSTWSWCCIYLSFKAWSHRLGSNTCPASNWCIQVN